MLATSSGAMPAASSPLACASPTTSARRLRSHKNILDGAAQPLARDDVDLREPADAATTKDLALAKKVGTNAIQRLAWPVQDRRDIGDELIGAPAHSGRCKSDLPLKW